MVIPAESLAMTVSSIHSHVLQYILAPPPWI